MVRRQREARLGTIRAMAETDISVIVRARDEAGAIGRCLELVRDQDVDGMRVETIVVDNGSRDQTVAIVAPTGAWNAKVTDRTKIWLDRSSLRQPNLKGTFADLRPGATVEVKPVGGQAGASGGPAEWIKVQVSASP